MIVPCIEEYEGDKTLVGIITNRLQSMYYIILLYPMIS